MASKPWPNVDVLTPLANGRPLLLDGPTGTELHRRGYETRLPLWSAGANLDATDLLENIHRDYVAAGAQVLTANTFRTNPSTLRQAGLLQHGPAMVAAAVQAAKAAANDASHMVRVAGSLAPVADCYRPDLVPGDGALQEEHAMHAAWMVEAGVDLLLVETMNTIREAVAATRAASATGLEVWTSLVLDASGDLLDGTPLPEAIQAMRDLGDARPDALLVNCCPIGAVTRAAPIIAENWYGPWGAYANIGTADPVMGWEQGRDVSVEEYVEAAREWVAAGAGIVGSCCGTTPTQTAALKHTFTP